MKTDPHATQTPALRRQLVQLSKIRQKLSDSSDVQREELLAHALSFSQNKVSAKARR